MSDNLALRILVVVELFVGLTAVAGGAAFLLHWISFPLELLSGSPLRSYDVPGLALMVVVGGSALAAVVAVKRRHPWGPALSGLAGIVLVGWIAVELAIVGLAGLILQSLYLALGVVMIILAARLWSDRRAPVSNGGTSVASR